MNQPGAKQTNAQKSNTTEGTVSLIESELCCARESRPVGVSL